MARVWPIALMSAAVVFDLVGALADEALLLLVARWLLAGGAVVGLVTAGLTVRRMARALGGRELPRLALLYPVAQVVSASFTAAALLARPTRVDQPPTASLALAVVGLGVWLVAEQLKEELFRGLRGPKRRAAPRLRVIRSPRA